MRHVLCGLAVNPALPGELVDRLIAVADEELAGNLVERADLPRAQAAALVARVEQSAVRLAERGLLTAGDVDPAARPCPALALLAEGAGRPEWARLFAADPDAGRRERLAACPGLPPDVQEALAADADVRVVAEFALWAPADLAARLAEHPHAEVRGAVAANEATPPAVPAALLSGEARRCLVCEREETPFAHDPYCPRPDCGLPAGAACDGSHESAVHDMQESALGNPATPAVAGFADHPSRLLRWALAERADLPAAVYEHLAGSPEPGIRETLAENPAIPGGMLHALAADADPEVRRGLARNPRVPLEVLTRLADTTRIGPTLLPRIAEGFIPAWWARSKGRPGAGAEFRAVFRRGRLRKLSPAWPAARPPGVRSVAAGARRPPGRSPAGGAPGRRSDRVV